MPFLRCAMLLLLVLFSGCHQRSSQHLSIGRDPTWFPCDFGEETAPINAFTNALFQAGNELGRPALEIVDTTWENLVPSLQKQRVVGILGAWTPLPHLQEQYEFSMPFLKIGPLLVVRVATEAHSLGELAGKIVAVSQFDQTVLLVQKYPSITIAQYQSVPQALEQLVAGEFDAVLIGALQAQALVPHLYPGVLKIASEPLTDEGLRLVTLKGKHRDVVELFDQRLKKLKASGLYEGLRTQFGVY